MRPSSPAGVGRVGNALVFLLPGNPVSCLCAYDFFAGARDSSPRRTAGGFPHRTVRATVARKIVSAIGRVDYCRVRLVERRGRAHRAERRIDPVLDHARRWLRDRAGRKRRLRARHRNHRVPLRLMTSPTASARLTRRRSRRRSSSTSSPATRRPRDSASICDLAPLGIETVALRRALDRVLARGHRARASTCPASIAPTSMASRCRRAIPSARWRNGRARAPQRRSARARRRARPSRRRRRATPIATGGMLPRGADAVLMVEHSETSPIRRRRRWRSAARSPPART